MEISRNYEINEKCFSKNKILSIAKKMHDELNNQIKPNNSSIEFIVLCDDNITYTQDDLSLFQENEIFDTKTIINLTFRLHLHSGEDYNRILFELDKRYSTGNKLKVSGEKSWVMNIFDDLKTIIDSSKPQTTFIKNYFTNIFISQSLTFLFALIGFFIFIYNYNDTNTFIFTYTFIQKELLIPLYFFSFLPSFLIAVGTQELVKRLYPSIEFDFGPEHKNLEKNRRSILKTIIATVCGTILIPFIMSTLSGLFLEKINQNIEVKKEQKIGQEENKKQQNELDLFKSEVK